MIYQIIKINQINLDFVDLKQNDYSFNQLEELNKFNLLKSFSSVNVPASSNNPPISNQSNRCKICFKSFDYIANLNACMNKDHKVDNRQLSVKCFNLVSLTFLS